MLRIEKLFAKEAQAAAFGKPFENSPWHCSHASYILMIFHTASKQLLKIQLTIKLSARKGCLFFKKTNLSKVMSACLYLKEF